MFIRLEHFHQNDEPNHLPEKVIFLTRYECLKNVQHRPIQVTGTSQSVDEVLELNEAILGKLGIFIFDFFIRTYNGKV
jgi:hypothetical protein